MREAAGTAASTLVVQQGSLQGWTARVQWPQIAEVLSRGRA